MNEYRFKAFISYSHADKGWSDWLQNALEAYRVPKHLVGSKGEFGPVPKRLAPVFRDREDLSSASDLSGKINEPLAGVAWQVGMVDMAIENYGEAREILSRLSAQEPSNLSARYEYLMREFFIGRLMMESGQMEQGLERANSVREPFVALLEEESGDNLIWRTSWASYLLDLSDMEWLADHPDRALRFLTEAEMQLERLLEQGQGTEPFIRELLHARFLHWQQTGRDLFESPPFNATEVNYEGSAKHCGDRVNLFRQAILTGERQIAEDLAGQLLDTGFFGPVFIRECRYYGVCDEGG